MCRYLITGVSCLQHALPLWPLFDTFAIKHDDRCFFDGDPFFVQFGDKVSINNKLPAVDQGTDLLDCEHLCAVVVQIGADRHPGVDQGHLQPLQGQQRALQPGRADFDAEQLQQVGCA